MSVLNLRRLLFQVMVQAGKGGRGGGGGGGGERGEIHRKRPWGHSDTHPVHFQLHVTSMTHTYTHVHAHTLMRQRNITNVYVHMHNTHKHIIPTQTSNSS